MLIALAMPQFGESITQALIIRWLKKVGETVAESEPIVEMETEKALFSYESPFRGKLTEILQGDGSQVAVGLEIGRFEVTEEDGKRYLSLGIGAEVGQGEVSRVEDTQKLAGGTAPAGKRLGLSPLLRSLAKEHGVPIEELGKVRGTGSGGRVTREDFLEFVRGREVSAPAREGVRTVSLNPIRARIAEKMVLSKQTIPHAGCSLDVDLQAIETWRTTQPRPPGYLPFAIVSALQALKKFPVLNSSWKEVQGRRWIEQYDFVHLGIAVATDQGLLVPVIRNAHRLSFKELSGEIDRLVEAGRKGRLTVEELTGATFSVNNAGSLGAVRSQQIIPHPQAAILAINRVVRRPWVVGEKIEVRPVMGLDLAFDHRLIDGDQAVGFLMEVARHLEQFDCRFL